MKLGFLATGIMRKMDFGELVRWSAAHGYQAVDVPDSVPNAINLVREAGLEPAATGGLPNLIVADEATRQANVARALDRLDEVARDGIPLVMLNHGKVLDKSDDENFEYARLGYT